MALTHLLLLTTLIVLYIRSSHGDGTLMTFRGLYPDSTFKRCTENIELKTANCQHRDLDSVPQNLGEDIQFLYLKANHITSLLSSSFERYRLLTHLDLSKNDIRMIEFNTFYPLKDLVYLDMSHNQHLALPDTGLLRWAKKLSDFNLMVSDLKFLPNDILKRSPHVHTLNLHTNQFTLINISSCGTARNVDLSDNKITNLTMEAFTFVCQSNYLDLRWNAIRYVDPGVIASLQVRYLVMGGYPLTFDVLRNIFLGVSLSTYKIEKVRIMSASLGLIPHGFFRPLHDCPLPVLDLSINQIRALYPLVFSNLTQIRLLNLSTNDIIAIEPEYFSSMHELRILDLSFNEIVNINPDGQEWAINLFELYLSSNSFKLIHTSAFLGLKSLMLLDLSYNRQLTVLQVNAFMGLHRICTIDLSSSRLVLVPLELLAPKLKSLKSLLMNNMVLSLVILRPGKAFTISPFLEHLDLRYSGIGIYNLWDPLFNLSLFEGLSNLTTLDLTGNYVNSIGAPGIFKPLLALKNLSLEACNISYVHALAFNTLEALQELNLKGNIIQQIHSDSLKGLGQVRSIDLANNQLAYLDKELFANNSKLKTLLLSNNKLARLNYSTFRLIQPSLSFFDLSMNPIDCNCDLIWLLHWMREPKGIIDGKKVICSSASLEPLHGKSLLDFNAKELCIMNVSLSILISLSVTSMVVIIVLVYHYRWQLKYTLFLLRLAVLGYKEIQDARDHNDYEFDLNIIFYDDDEDWIREHLRPVLEQRLRQFQRNVFGDNDLVLGMHYLDSVDYVVSNSYKTIIVLSRAAVRDRWFMLKFRTAMDHVSDTQTEFVVVVFFEDIPDDEIPFLARLYLSDGRPYLFWPEDVRGQQYFWQELTKSLTVNLRTNDLIPNE